MELAYFGCAVAMENKRAQQLLQHQQTSSAADREAGSAQCNQDKDPDPNFSLGREKQEWDMYPTFQFLGGRPKGQESVSTDSRVLMGNQRTLEAWILQRSKEFSGLLQQQRTCSTVDTH